MIKIDQIAFGCQTKGIWDQIAKAASAVDQVAFEGNLVADGFIKPIVEIGYLAFNYELGIEVEHLFYPYPRNTFHRYLLHPDDYSERPFFLSHMGAHVDDIDAVLKEMSVVRPPQVVMDVETRRHTNPKIQDRSYRYVIIDQRSEIGFFLKLIQRIKVERVQHIYT
jgi:hypothetical protein